MTVHVGEITSEVMATDAAAPERQSGEVPEWEERCRIEAMIERLASDRLRTATGQGHD